MEPSLKNAITLAINSPSRCLLMRTFPFPLRFAKGIIKSLPCQKQTMKFSPFFQPSATVSLFTCLILRVTRSRLRNTKIRGGRTLTMRKALILLFIFGSLPELNDFLNLFITKLKIVKVFIRTFSFNKLGVCTFLYDGPAIDHDDPVSIHNS